VFGWFSSRLCEHEHCASTRKQEPCRHGLRQNNPATIRDIEPPIIECNYLRALVAWLPGLKPLNNVRRVFFKLVVSDSAIWSRSSAPSTRRSESHIRRLSTSFLLVFLS